MKWLFGLMIGLLASSAVSAQTHLVVWPVVTSTTGFGTLDFLMSGNIVPDSVTLVSFDVTAPVDGIVMDRYGLNVAMVANESRTIVANIKYSNPFWDSLSFQVAGRPGIYVPSAFANVTFEVSNAGSPLPEPASWGLLIGGFGVAGAAVRGRRWRTATA